MRDILLIVPQLAILGRSGSGSGRPGESAGPRVRGGSGERTAIVRPAKAIWNGKRRGSGLSSPGR
jgi:hypothetical protein